MANLEVVKSTLTIAGSILTIISNTISICKASYKSWRKAKHSATLGTEERDVELGILTEDDALGSFGDAVTDALRRVLEPFKTKTENNHDDLVRRVEGLETKHPSDAKKTDKRLGDSEKKVTTLEKELRELRKRVDDLEKDPGSPKHSAPPSRPGSPGLRHRTPIVLKRGDRLEALTEEK